MDITIYLPDEIGRWAKDNDVNLSGMLRSAVEREREYREFASDAQKGSKVHSLRVEGGNSYYTVRLHAKEMFWDGRNQWLYLTQDGTVYVYDGDAERLHDMSDEDAENWRDSNPEFYVAIMSALGEEAVIDIGQS